MDLSNLPVPKRDVLAVPPKLAMTLLKDKDLKQKLAHYGLSALGKRSVRPCRRLLLLLPPASPACSVLGSDAEY